MNQNGTQKKISIWGSTGSIGTQTLEVIAQYPNRFSVSLLSGHRNIDLLYKQAEQFKPKIVVVTGEIDIESYHDSFKSLGVKLYSGQKSLLDLADHDEQDIVVNALVGAVGLKATLKAIDQCIPIALANKEVLVMAGKLVMSKARARNVPILPIDSEHSAIFQVLQGEPQSGIRRILLTASGGPFLKRDFTDFKSITVEEALKHPNWDMGNKITIDSATMMNKGLEIIEARWLFGVMPDQIEVVIHPQSIVHSMVEFQDGSIKAQLGWPDMRVPIAYALTYPDRWEMPFGSMDFSKIHQLEFQPPDLQKFPALRLALQALKSGGTGPCVFNAADEVAVAAFLNKKIGFTDIPMLVESALSAHQTVQEKSLDVILEADQWARVFVKGKI